MVWLAAQDFEHFKPSADGHVIPRAANMNPTYTYGKRRPETPPAQPPTATRKHSLTAPPLVRRSGLVMKQEVVNHHVGGRCQSISVVHACRKSCAWILLSNIIHLHVEQHSRASPGTSLAICHNAEIDLWVLNITGVDLEMSGLIHARPAGLDSVVPGAKAWCFDRNFCDNCVQDQQESRKFSKIPGKRTSIIFAPLPPAEIAQPDRFPELQEQQSRAVAAS